MPVKSPSEGLAGFWEEFEAQYDAGGFFMMILYPFLTGRLVRWNQVEAWIEDTLTNRNVWFTTLDQIADHLDSLVARGEWRPTIENLPYYPGTVLEPKDGTP